MKTLAIGNAQTLVLDCGFFPVACVSWQRAVTLLWEGKVEVIEEHEDKVVRSVTIEFKLPSVIRFLRAVRGKKRSIKFSRENVFSRDKGRCQYCKSAVSRSEFTYDHVTPRAQGGETRWENVVVCCTACNQRKGGRTPGQAGLQLTVAPVKPHSLPDVFRLTFRVGYPDSWKTWIRDVAYWHGELEHS